MITKQKRQINPKYKFVNVIGCGFAGIEAALFLAGHGVKVHVFNAFNRDIAFDEENNLSEFDLLLQKELSFLGSPLAKAKEVGLNDKELLDFGLKMVNDNENIEFFEADIAQINPSEVNLIATGNSTSENMFGFLQDKLGSMRILNNMPAFAVVENVGELLLYKNKAKENEWLYPLTEKEYLLFINKVVDEINKLKDKNFVRGTIEYLVDKGRDVLRNSSIPPVGIDGISKPYATIRLKRAKNGFEIQNFATNLSKSAQSRIICSLIPFKNAIIKKEASVTQGSYINSKYVVNGFCQSKLEENLFFCGGILGLKTVPECMASGLMAGLNILKHICDQRKVMLPQKTAIGKIAQTLTCMEEYHSQTAKTLEYLTENCSRNDFDASKIELEKFKGEYINGKYV